MSHDNEEGGDPDILILPCPGQSVSREDHEFKTFKLRVNPPPTVDVLRNHLGSLGLIKSGRKAELVQRLRKFSENSKEWDSMLLPARYRGRGTTSKHGTKQKSQLAQRIADEFGETEIELTFQSKKSGTATRPVVVISEQKEVANDRWAAAVLRKRDAQRDMQAQASASDTSVGPVTGIPGENTQVVDAGSVASKEYRNKDVRQLQRHITTIDRVLQSQFGSVHSQLNDIQTNLAMLSATQVSPHFSTLTHSTYIPGGISSRFATHLPVSSLPGVPASSAAPGGVPTALPGLVNSVSSMISEAVRPAPVPSPHRPPGIASPHIILPPRTVIPRAAIPPEYLLIFDLDGEELAFDKRQVPDPPKLTFADNIPGLFREWHESTILTVNGRGIAIKHWDRFYKKRARVKDFAWEKARVEWGNWKFLVKARERFPSEDAFWDKYTDAKGKRFNYQKILDSLKSQRMTTAEKDTAEALWFFDGDLTHADAHGRFIYKKHRVCTAPPAIGPKWRKLLRDFPDVAERWEMARMFYPQPDPDTSDPQSDADMVLV